MVLGKAYLKLRDQPMTLLTAIPRNASNTKRKYNWLSLFSRLEQEIVASQVNRPRNYGLGFCTPVFEDPVIQEVVQNSRVCVRIMEPLQVQTVGPHQPCDIPKLIRSQACGGWSVDGDGK
jgi:hypothetical protein